MVLAYGPTIPVGGGNGPWILCGRSCRERQGAVPRLLLQARTSAEPGGVESTAYAPRATVMVDVLRHGVHQPPGCVLGRVELRASSLAAEQLHNCLRNSAGPDCLVLSGEERGKVGLGCVARHCGARQPLHLAGVGLPLAVQDAELTFDFGCVELTKVGDADNAILAPPEIACDKRRVF